MSKPTASQVPRLPRLVAGSSVLVSAAERLCRVRAGAAAWSVDDPAEREALVAELMSVDPCCLTLWTACAWSQPAWGTAARIGRGGRSLRAASWTWPSGSLATPARLADWSAEELAESPSGAGTSRSRWRELAADAVAVANLAADPIADDEVAAEAFLLGLLHNAADWLRSCGPRISIPKQQLAACPSGWCPLARAIAGPAQRTGAAGGARRQMWRESGRRRRQVAGVDVTEALWARRRWQTSRPVSRSQLAHLWSR